MILNDERIDRIVLILLFVFEALICYAFYSRDVAWYPPANFDQSEYLSWAYRIENKIVTKGPLEIARQVLSKGHATGVALPVEGALSGLLLGGTRFPQLLVLFLTFCALQIFAFYTGRTVWNSRAYGYLFLGLVLCQGTPWFWAGGLFDFRMDFSAYCLYGMWVCAAIRSELFLNLGWSLVCGVLGALLVLHRFLSGAYVIGVWGGFAVFCVAAILVRRRDVDFARRMQRRLRFLGFSAGAFAVLALPFVLRNWAAIYEYYVFSHAVSARRFAWAHELGLNTLKDHALFYPISILRDHFGLAFILGSAIAIIAGFLSASVYRPRKETTDEVPTLYRETFLLQIVFLLGAIAGPLIVLVSDLAKSPVVGGVIGVPSAALVTALAAYASTARAGLRPIGSQKIVLASSLLIFALGITNVCVHLLRNVPEVAERRDLEQLTELDTWMVNYAHDHGFTTAWVSFDVLSPWLNAFGIAATGYEKSGVYVDFRARFGKDVLGTDKVEALAALAQSDFVILTEPTRPPNENSDDGISVVASTSAIRQFPSLAQRPFPFYARIAPYWKELKDWADKNMLVARTVKFNNFVATVYVRPNAVPVDNEPDL